MAQVVVAAVPTTTLPYLTQIQARSTGHHIKHDIYVNAVNSLGGKISCISNIFAIVIIFFTAIPTLSNFETKFVNMNDVSIVDSMDSTFVNGSFQGVTNIEVSLSLRFLQRRRLGLTSLTYLVEYLVRTPAYHVIY
jgi:hypothetical protein